MNNIEIRKVTLNDLNALQKIGKQTFSDAYAFNNDKESMDAYLKNGFSTEKLKVELTDQNSEFYFAHLDHKVIGYLKVNFGISQTDIKDDKALEIERIYLLKNFYGKKIGQQLLEKSVLIAKLKNLEYIWLSVWEKNPKAIKFYERNGFVQFNKHTFTLGEEKQTDIMMRLVLAN